MKNFDAIKHIWSENEPDTNTSAHPMSKSKKDHLSLLSDRYLLSAIGLFSFTLFVVWFAFLSDRNFMFDLSYTALSLLAICSFIMVLINLYNVFLIRKLNETLPPKVYLNHWLLFYTKRFLFFRRYAPILFIATCFSFALYVPEILGYYPTSYYKTGFVVFIILIFIVFHLLGKKSLSDEKRKLNELNATFQMLSKD